MGFVSHGGGGSGLDASISLGSIFVTCLVLAVRSGLHA